MNDEPRRPSACLRGLGRATLTTVLTFQLVFAGMAVPAHAGTFATSEYLAASVPAADSLREARVERVRAFMAEERVARQLASLGVDAEDARRRVASLSDAELAQLDGRLEALEAGGSVVGIIGAVFIVLLVLELLGVTNVFTAF